MSDAKEPIGAVIEKLVAELAERRGYEGERITILENEWPYLIFALGMAAQACFENGKERSHMNDNQEIPPPSTAVERLEGVLLLLGGTWASCRDPQLLAALPELTCVVRSLITLGRKHPDELHEIYLEDRRQPMPFGLLPPAYPRPR